MTVNVQVLKIVTIKYSHKLDNLPSSIKYFELNISAYKNTQELNNLPDTIETIKVRYFTFMLKIQKLQSSIKKIIIVGYWCDEKLIDNEKINAHLQTMCYKQKLDGVVCEIEKK